VQVASRRTDHRQPPAPSALLYQRSTPGLRTSHVSHPRSRPVVRISAGLPGTCPLWKAHCSAQRCTAAQGGCSGAHAFQLWWWGDGMGAWGIHLGSWAARSWIAADSWFRLNGRERG
jgi:hypothetical protein